MTLCSQQQGPHSFLWSLPLTWLRAGSVLSIPVPDSWGEGSCLPLHLWSFGRIWSSRSHCWAACWRPKFVHIPCAWGHGYLPRFPWILGLCPFLVFRGPCEWLLELLHHLLPYYFPMPPLPRYTLRVDVTAPSLISWFCPLHLVCIL